MSLPVAWRVRDFADGWVLFSDEARARHEAGETGALIQPLYATPPDRAPPQSAPCSAEHEKYRLTETPSKRASS